MLAAIVAAILSIFGGHQAVTHSAPRAAATAAATTVSIKTQTLDPTANSSVPLSTTNKTPDTTITHNPPPTRVDPPSQPINGMFAALLTDFAGLLATMRGQGTSSTDQAQLDALQREISQTNQINNLQNVTLSSPTISAPSITGLSTSQVSEGSNLYYTDARAEARINATSSIGTLLSAPNLTAVGTLSSLFATNATTTNLAITGTASTSALIASNSFTFETVTGFLKATAGAVATSLINLAADVTGILPVANGGTGWANIAASAIPYGNGSSALATTTAGTAGYVLAYLNGVPTWTATTTLANISGTLAISSGGTGAITFGQGWIYSNGGTGTLAASTSPTVNYIVATSSTATSTFAAGLQSSYLNLTGTSATSTAANGFNLSAGCFAVNGTCVGSGAGSGTVGSGVQGQFPFYNAAGTTLTATSTLFISQSGNVGIGTTNPLTPFQVTNGGGYFGVGFDSAGAGQRPVFKSPGGFHFQDVVTDTSGSSGLLNGAVGIVNDIHVIPAPGDDAVETYLSGEFSTSASGNNPLLASVVIDNPSGFYLNGATATNLAALYINGAIPIPGGLTVTGDSYGLLVVSGGTSHNLIQGLLTVGNSNDNVNTFGPIVDTTAQLATEGNFTGQQMFAAGGNQTAPSGSVAQILEVSGQIHAAQNKNAYGLDAGFTGQLFTSGTHALMATAHFAAPLFGLNGATLTEASTLYIAGAPTGATNNYALHVAGGSSIFAGNVGIGNTSPSYKLDVTGAGHFTSYVDAANFVATSTSVASTFGYNVGIGTTSPDMLLSVGSATPVGNVAHFENSTGSCYINPTTGVSCSSDSRLKTNINSLTATSGIAALMQLNPVTYNWTAEATGTPTHMGFIAQQVQPILPDLVSQGPDGYYTLNYAGFTPYLVKAVQEIASISGMFEQNLIAWLGNASNGIGDLFAKNLYATNVTADTGNFHHVTADELCAGTVCVNQQQLAAILAAAGQSNSAASGGSSSSSQSNDPSTTRNTPPVIQINGANPATIHVGDSYADLGATITGPQADLNLGLKYLLNGALVSNIVIDTSAATTDTIDYVATDQAGNTATSTRAVIIEGQASSLPAASNASTSTATSTSQ
jgi:hypothetical protein